MKRYIYRFIFGGSLYILIEVLWRLAVNHRSTNITMFFLAGLVYTTILHLEDKKHNIWITSLVGMLIATAGELIIGTISVDIFNVRLWQYGGLTYRGIISLKWSLLWYVLCFFVIIAYRKLKKNIVD